MWFLTWIDTIFSLIWDIAVYFSNISSEIEGVPGVGGILSTFFWWVYERFWSLLDPIAHFYDWVYEINEAINTFLTESDIWSILAKPIEYATNAWIWVKDAFWNVWDVVSEWWLTTYKIVQGWIAIALQTAKDLISVVEKSLAAIQEAWDSFKGKIPSIDGVITWFSNWWGNVTLAVTTWWNGAILQVQDLISTAFTLREDWWAGWVNWRDQVVEFFTDPVEFVWQKFTDWFLGPEA